MSDTYIDFEPPAWAEVDAVVAAGSSTIVQSPDAAFPERGNVGLRCSTTAGNSAYVQKNNWCDAIAPGGSIFVGQYYRLNAVPSSWTQIMSLVFGGLTGLGVYCENDRDINANIIDDTPSNKGTASFRLELDRWYWMVWELIRASDAVSSDGGARLYIDGSLEVSRTDVDNYHRLAGAGSAFQVGCVGAARDGYVADCDEIKIATSYPEPYAPTPETDYPEARRTVVLFRQDSSDSREFADYCVEQLGVPRCNLCPLPNATANESLASYATFQTEVETDLAAWLGRNPTVATNCSTFLIGYGVPGYFTSGAVKHSATSRLMNYGTAFSSQTANPLYNPATVTRLTKSDLSGKYLCTRIDADTLQHAKDVLDCGLQIADCGLNDNDKLYSDESDYLASLNCQHLRIQTAAMATLTDDAFVWGAFNGLFGSSGSRAFFCDDRDYIAETLRSASYLFSAVVTNGYASGLGSSESLPTFDADSFFEMLRIGGTLAEALVVSIANLDYMAVSVGSPLITVAFSTCGYNIYRGVGDISNVDFDNPVAYLRAGQNAPVLTGLGHLPAARYTYVLLPVRNGLEGNPPSCTFEFVTDANGDWIGDRPVGAELVEAEADSDGKITVRWTYRTPYGGDSPHDFAIYYSTSGQISQGNPQAVEEYSSDGEYSYTFNLADGQSYHFALSARTAGGVESQLSKSVGPVVADANAPQTPMVFTGTRF